MPSRVILRCPFAILAATILAAAACAPAPTAAPGPSASAGSRAASPPASPSPRTGGTIYLLADANGLSADPQYGLNGEDPAFFSGTVSRSLESFEYSPDPIMGSTLTPDMATDLGTPSDGGSTWTFTLRDGVTWQDGSRVTCADVKYGVSRAFNFLGSYPTDAIKYLDVPLQPGPAANAYPGPYLATPAQQALFDRAVTCSPDNRSITFHLNAPRADFPYMTTFGFGAVPNPKDHPGVDASATDVKAGVYYGMPSHPVWSDGPYKVQRYSTGTGGKLLLVRNPSWNRASDPIRAAYPDGWEVDFGIDAKIADQRLIASSGNDAFALGYDPVQTADLTTVFDDPHTAKPPFAGRAVSALDGSVRYVWIDVTKVPSLQARQAMLVALDRQTLLSSMGGPFTGDEADGMLAPTIGVDYASTGIWDSFRGRAVPTSGDPALARQLIAESGKPVPTLTVRYFDFPNLMTQAAILEGSLAEIGVTVKGQAVDPRSCTFGCPRPSGGIGFSNWYAAWPDASSVIPELFTGGQRGRWNLSNVDDAAFNAAVQDAVSTLDPGQRAQKWQALNRWVVEQAWAVPLSFGLRQSLAGTNVGPIYRWPAYNSWPYGVMYVTP